MPLIVICGLPSSGKSYRSRQLASYFQRRINGDLDGDEQAPADAVRSDGATLAPQLSALNLEKVEAKPLPTSRASGNAADASAVAASESNTFAKLVRPSKANGLDPKPSSKQTNLKVHLISDHSCHLPRSIYGAGNAKLEKDGRATLYSAVKRALTKQDIVILDSGNYIKGWRYQLHCEAKNVGTASCVVHVGVPVEKSRGVNDARLAAVEGDETAAGKIGTSAEDAPYDTAVHAELLMRFEEPNPMARWDSPLFTVPWDDEEPPSAAIWQELIEGIGKDGRRKIVRPNLATVAPASSSSDHLYELDRTTQLVVSRIQEHQRDRPGESGGEVDVQVEGKTLTLELPLSPLTVGQLQRLRRQFITLHRQQMGSTGAGGAGGGGGGLSQQRVGELFVGFLESQWS